MFQGREVFPSGLERIGAQCLLFSLVHVAGICIANLGSGQVQL